MKKLLALLLVCVMVLGVFAGCQEEEAVDSKVSLTTDASSEETVSDDSSDSDTESEDPSSEEEPIIDDGGSVDTDDYSYTDDDDLGDYTYEEEELTPEEQRLESVLAGEDDELNKAAITNEGNLARLAKAIKKSKGGKNVNIVCYGGWNTGNNGDTTIDGALTYSALLAEWWAANIGPCTVYNQGLPALTSVNACMRVDRDVLRFEPDVVFLDFAVQDGLSGLGKSNAVGYDNLIRRILQSDTSPAIISLMLTGAEQTTYTMNPDNCKTFATATKYQTEVCDYYDIPVIDMDSCIWDIMSEIVQVDNKGDIPLMTWESISSTALLYSPNGHKVLYGMIKQFIENAVAKLDKISTKDPSYPTVGFFANDKYMKGSTVDIQSIAEGTTKGYSVDLDLDDFSDLGYTLNKEETPGKNAMLPNIHTYRHYIDETDPEKNIYPHYLEVTIPEVKKDETAYFQWCCSKSVGTAYRPTYVKFNPCTLECYDATGKMVTVGYSGGYYSDEITQGRFFASQIPSGTTRIVIKTYTGSGTIRMLGIGRFQQ